MESVFIWEKEWNEMKSGTYESRNKKKGTYEPDYGLRDIRARLWNKGHTSPTME